MAQKLSVLSILLRTVMILKISGFATASKSEFTLRSWKRSFLDITLRAISDKSSKGMSATLSGMALDAERPQGCFTSIDVERWDKKIGQRQDTGVSLKEVEAF
jgi:hypothetical protein